MRLIPYGKQYIDEQLKENISSIKIELSSDLLKEIDEIHNENPFPCP